MQTQGANRIAELRTEKGLIRSELAGALKVDQSTLWRWETGARIDDEKKLALAAFFGVSPGYLMGWTNEREAA